MNALRELVLILSTFLWIGGAAWITMAIVATGVAVEEQVADVAPYGSYYVFAAGVLIFLLTSFLWKKKRDL